MQNRNIGKRKHTVSPRFIKKSLLFLLLSLLSEQHVEDGFQMVALVKETALLLKVIVSKLRHLYREDRNRYSRLQSSTMENKAGAKFTMLPGAVNKIIFGNLLAFNVKVCDSNFVIFETALWQDGKKLKGKI